VGLAAVGLQPFHQLRLLLSLYLFASQHNLLVLHDAPNQEIDSLGMKGANRDIIDFIFFKFLLLVWLVYNQLLRVLEMHLIVNNWWHFVVEGPEQCQVSDRQQLAFLLVLHVELQDDGWVSFSWYFKFEVVDDVGKQLIFCDGHEIKLSIWRFDVDVHPVIALK